jgi:hypothetical protein
MGAPPLTPVVRNLLIACVVIGALQWWQYPRLEIHFALWAPGEAGLFRFRPWQLVTSAFLHADWIHLALNCVALNSFGPPVEKLLGSRRFGTCFLVCAIGGSLLQLLAQKWGLSHAGYCRGLRSGLSAREHHRVSHTSASASMALCRRPCCDVTGISVYGHPARHWPFRPPGRNDWRPRVDALLEAEGTQAAYLTLWSLRY